MNGNSEGREFNEPKFKDSSSGEGNYQGGGSKSVMARIVEKLRAIGNDSSESQMDFNKNRPATETSAFLPKYVKLVNYLWFYIPFPLKCIASLF